VGSGAGLCSRARSPLQEMEGSVEGATSYRSGRQPFGHTVCILEVLALVKCQRKSHSVPHLSREATCAERATAAVGCTAVAAVTAADANGLVVTVRPAVYPTARALMLAHVAWAAEAA